jgi:hypothetical protein
VAITERCVDWILADSGCEDEIAVELWKLLGKLAFGHPTILNIL